MMVRKLLLLALSLPVLSFGADRILDHNFHGWYSYFGDHPIHGDARWGVHLEGQYRRHDVLTKWQQLLLRPGVNYRVNRNLMLSAGYAFVRTSAYGEYVTPAPPGKEHRFWEQAWIRYRKRKIAFSNRLRMEHRFLGGGGVTGYRYENRFRGWQQIKIPIAQRLYVNAYDELWFYIKPYRSNSAFDQNRAYAGLGIDVTPTLRFEAGYMNQSILVRTGTRLESNHTLMFTFFSDAPLFRKR